MNGVSNEDHWISRFEDQINNADGLTNNDYVYKYMRGIDNGFESKKRTDGMWLRNVDVNYLIIKPPSS